MFSAITIHFIHLNKKKLLYSKYPIANVLHHSLAALFRLTPKSKLTPKTKKSASSKSLASDKEWLLCFDESL